MTRTTLFCLTRGRYAYFSTEASLPPSDTNNAVDTHVVDLMTGQRTRVTRGASGQQLAEGGRVVDIHPDGSAVVFTSVVDTLQGQ